MRGRPREVCTCITGLRVCPICKAAEEQIETKFDPVLIPAEKLKCRVTGWVTSEFQPWRDSELPAHLCGFGHRVADQDGGRGDEWLLPQDDHDAQMIEAARVLLDAEEIERR